MRKLLLAIAAFLCLAAAHAQTVTPADLPFITFVDASGNPCAGCKLYSYIAGSTNPLPTYTDATGVSQNSNPIVLNAAGGAQIWMGNNSYKFILKTATEATIWTVDQVRGGGGGTIATVANIAGLRNYPGSGMVNLIGYYSPTLTSEPDGGGGNFLDIGAGVSGDDDGGVTIYDATTGHKWRRQFVNLQMPVTYFGARGDCTNAGSTASCSDNLTNLQNALNYCYTTRCLLTFPGNQTDAPAVYWISGTLNPKGVSMEGPQRGDIANNTVALRGSPSLDILAPGDPTAGGYVRPNPTFHVTNLTFIVDDTVDASASFTHRLPGKTVLDGVCAATSAVVTSSTMLFQPGDVGSAFRAYGCGPAGANLDTTIASVQSFSQATMAATASTTVASNAHFYLSIKGLSVTQTVGNCAFAYDDYSTAAYLTHGVSHSNFENINVISVDNTLHNHSCGMFFQGDAGVYDTKWSSAYIQGLDFGMVFANPTTGMNAHAGSSGMADFNVFEKGFIGANYPWISYGGNDDKISSTQFCDTQGPHILLAPNSVAANYPVQWSLDIPEQECSGAGAISYRVSGQNHIIERLSSAGNSTLQWDANNTVLQSYTPGESTVNIAGNHNEFHISAYPLGVPATFSITGVGNVWDGKTCGEGASNCIGRKHVGPVGTGNNADFASTFGSPSVSRSTAAFDRKADFIWDGDDAYYFNREDLWLWPTEVHAAGGYTATTQTDSASATGYDLLVNNTSYFLDGSNNEGWYYGKQVPAKSKVRLIIRAKANTNIAGWTATIATSRGGFTGLCNIVMNLTTTAANGSCDADSSLDAGNSVYINLNASGDPAKQVQIEYLAIRPWSSATITTSLTVGTGTAITDNQGNGAKVQHSTGTTTTNNCAKFDANGNVVDSGAACQVTARVCSGSAPNESCYETFGNGTIHEFGTIQSGTLSGTWKATATLTFPLAFPTAIHSIICNPGSPGGSGDATNPIICSTNSASTTAATLYTACVVEIGGGGCSATKNNVTLNWDAWGH